MLYLYTLLNLSNVNSLRIFHQSLKIRKLIVFDMYTVYIPKMALHFGHEILHTKFNMYNVHPVLMMLVMVVRSIIPINLTLGITL